MPQYSTTSADLSFYKSSPSHSRTNNPKHYERRNCVKSATFNYKICFLAITVHIHLDLLRLRLYIAAFVQKFFVIVST